MNHIASPTGISLSYDKVGNGPPLVLVHGGFSDHRTNWEFVKPLLRNHFTLYAVARRGRGETDATEGHRLADEGRVNLERLMKMKVLKATVVVLIVGLFPMFAAAQSKDKDKPTPMTSTEVSGVSRKQDRRELYYSFTAGPGELAVTLDVEGLSGRSDRESLVRLTFYDQEFHEVGQIERQSGLNGEKKRHVERYNFPKPTPLVMRLTFETGASKYKVGLGGEVSVERPPNPAVPSAETLRLPKAGVLTIKMRDGSVQTIDLKEIQDAKIDTEPPRQP